MAGAEGADDALRFLLDNGLVNGLDGPLGLADSAQWVTGAANPTAVPSWADNWNMTLSTMALMEFLEGPDRASLFFANLPEVEAALDTVFDCRRLQRKRRRRSRRTTTIGERRSAPDGSWPPRETLTA